MTRATVAARLMAARTTETGEGAMIRDGVWLEQRAPAVPGRQSAATGLQPIEGAGALVSVCVCSCACARACVRACVRVRVCACVHAQA